MTLNWMSGDSWDIPFTSPAISGAITVVTPRERYLMAVRAQGIFESHVLRWERWSFS